VDWWSSVVRLWRNFFSWQPYLFVLIEEIKPRFIEGHDIFPALALERISQVQEAS
jgi:hypothetical protein